MSVRWSVDPAGRHKTASSYCRVHTNLFSRDLGKRWVELGCLSTIVLQAQPQVPYINNYIMVLPKFRLSRASVFDKSLVGTAAGSMHHGPSLKPAFFSKCRLSRASVGASNCGISARTSGSQSHSGSKSARNSIQG